jgi:hypothetical protein
MPAAHARKPLAEIKSHVLLPYAGSILEADDRLAPLLTRRSLLARSSARCPTTGSLPGDAGLPDPAAHRAPISTI